MIGMQGHAALQIFILGILAGVYIGFGALLALTCGGTCPGLAENNPGLKQMVMGLFGLPTGLLMVMVAGAELFTGNTAVVTAAVAEGKASMANLVKSWTVSWLGNLAGSVGLALLTVHAGLLTSTGTIAKVAATKTSMAFLPVREQPLVTFYRQDVFRQAFVCHNVFKGALPLQYVTQLSEL